MTGGRVRNDFIEQAIEFYSGYVSSQSHKKFLSEVIVDAVRATVTLSENRISRLLFKIAVELAKLEFEAVQRIMEFRSRNIKKEKRREYIFTSKIACALNKETYIRRKAVSGEVYWICSGYINKSCNKKCSRESRGKINESDIKEKFIKVFNKLLKNRDILESLIERLENAQAVFSSENTEFENLNKKYSELESREQILTQMFGDGYLEPDFFISEMNKVQEEKEELNVLQKGIAGRNEFGELAESSRKILNILNGQGTYMETFDEIMFEELVNKVFIDEGKNITFELINKMVLSEETV